MTSELQHSFEVSLKDLGEVAANHLPDLATLMSTNAQKLYSLRPVGTSKVSSALCGYGDTLAKAIMSAAAAVEDTALTLHDIAELYRRADGQAR